MPNNHLITKTYSVLRGFSTDSKYVRPANVADKAINIVRLPDGTLSPRRGYQVKTDDIGGLGNGVYENEDLDIEEPICIHRDGNLYVEKTGSMTISFDDPNNNPSSYVSYEIFVDPSTVSDTQDCDFDPYLTVDDSALVNDSIHFRLKSLTAYSGVVVGTGLDTYTSVLAGFPLTPGSIVMTDGTLTIQDDAVGGFFGDVGVGTNVIDYATGAYTVTFSGVTGPVVASYRSSLQEQFDSSMGKGYLTALPFSISDLVSLLGGITGVTVVTTGVTSYPGAFIEVSEETVIADGQSVTLNWKYWESANRTVPSTFSGLASQINDDDFRIATFASFDETIFIASKFDEVQKFDGQTVYRAGMPQGALPTLAAVDLGIGTVTDGDHNYYVTYEQIDATGRLVEGRLSVGAPITTAGSQNVDVTVTNLLQGSGWNTDGALVDGVQLAVNTILVDDSVGGVHSLQVGDIAYFQVTGGSYETRTITSVTANSITIDGAAVDVSDNVPISNNLKINIYRTKDSGTEPFLVTTLANDSYSAPLGTQVFKDELPDATLGTGTHIRYIFPTREPDPPPKVGIVIAFGRQLIFTDDPVNDDFVWFSDITQLGSQNPEYVPRATNRFSVPSSNDSVNGAGVSGSTLVIFKNKSIYSVNGDLLNNQFVVTSVAPGSNIGCVSHHSIASVGGLLYFLHTNGVYSMVETQLYPTDKDGNPIPATIMIDRIFREDKLEEDEKYVLKRSTAINYTKDNQYLLFLPAEDKAGPRSSNEHSRVLCYDYQGKNWFEWTRVDAGGGWYIIDDNLYWQDRKEKNTTITSKEYKQHRKYRLIDNVDHVTPTRVTWESSWEDTGQPLVRKKFIRSMLLFDDISSMFQQNIPTLCFTSYKDWVERRVSTRVDVMQKINSNRWSTDHWSWLAWSGYQDTFVTVPLKGGTVAKSLKISLQLNTINSSFRLQGFQQEIAPDFRKTVTR